MIIERKRYLDKLISKKDNGLIKVITGIRRCGKSFLLFELYHEYLNSVGITDDCIIEIALDEAINSRYKNPFELDKYVREMTCDKTKRFYVFIDEVQLVLEMQNPYVNGVEDKIGFVPVLIGLMKLKNVDLYVTGSNSKMLSTDILTEFKDRGDEIKVNPLTFKEFYNAYQGDKHNAWKEYFTYGGMPFVLFKNSPEEKSKYLKGLFAKTYITDVIERNKINNDKDVLEDLLNILSSAIGSLTNPSKLSKTFKSTKNININSSTISKYIDYFVEAYIVSKSERYDIKGKKYMETPLKYYYTDVGLRNARLNFRQMEENHIMENIIYNELVAREYNVDVGIVEYNQKDSKGKNIRTQLEIDFVVNSGSNRCYIQSALSVADEEKRQQEIKSLKRVPDSFKKIVVVKDDIIPWYDEDGIYYIGIEQFLLDENCINM
ncbi:MAG: ATP-binding protein [Clostridia bacterium]|nr:ATP-binding protein [Clostridia bacterium]